MSRPGRGGPRLPTALLVAVVVACLAGSAWLFFAGDDSDDDARRRATEETTRTDVAEGELQLPDDDEPTDERRRDQGGRDRLDPDDAIRGDADEPASRDDALPSVMTNARGLTIALLSASAAGAAGEQGRVRVAGRRVPCAGAADAARAGVEADVLDRVATILERAGADVVRADTPAACVDERVERTGDASIVLLVRAGTGDPTVYAGVPAAGDADPGSRALAGELAAAVDLDAVTQPRTAADRTRLTQYGAVDVRDASSVAIVEVDLRDADDDSRAALALELATALGTAASRADVDS